MADKPDKKPDEKPAAAAAPSPAQAEKKPAAAPASPMKSTPALLAIVMILEGGLLFGAFKMFGGGPKSAGAADLNVPAEAAHGAAAGGHGAQPNTPKVDGKKQVELSVLEFKAPNKLTGRTFLYDVSIYISVKAEVKDKVKAAIGDREATIKDRIRTIIAQSDPEKLGGGSEPGLETLRRQVKFQLDELVGEGLIDEVLIPRCIPYRAEF